MGRDKRACSEQAPYSALKQGAHSTKPFIPPCPLPLTMAPTPHRAQPLLQTLLPTSNSKHVDEAASRSRAKPLFDPLPHVLTPNPGGETLPHVQGREPLRQPGTHSMSPSWASCFSATCRSFWGSPSRSKRSFSPYRLPRPMVRFVLWRTRVRATSLGTGHLHGQKPAELCGAARQLCYL